MPDLVDVVIPDGSPVVAMGAPRREGNAVVLVRPTLGRSGVSTREMGDLRDATARTDRDTWSLVRGLATFGPIAGGGGLAVAWLVQRLAG